MTTSTKSAVEEFPEVIEDKTKATPAETTFADKVNDAVSNMKQKEDGTWELPKGLDEAVSFAANAERRRRDTQSSHDKTLQELNVTKSKAEKLEAKLLESVQLDLSKEEREELAELKETDQDAWRTKLNEHEQTAKNKRIEELNAIDSETSKDSEITRREKVLKSFLDENPGLVLNDEVFENDLPPRLVKKLAEGDIAFEEFLVEAKDFLGRTTTTKKDEDDEEDVNLGKAGGGDRVSDAAINEDTMPSYENTIF